MGRVPKNGLGVATSFGLGDAEEEAGEGVPGVKALALGLGLNDEALAFNRAVGDCGGFNGAVCAES